MLKNGTVGTVRPIHPDDEPRLVAFHQSLSEQSVSQRYFQPLALGERVAHRRLARIAFNDYDREIALVAPADDEIVVFAWLSKVSALTARAGRAEGRFLLLINDAYQNMGLGTELLRRLQTVAHDEGLGRLSADILAVNTPMQRICSNIGFTLGPTHGQPSIVTAEISP